jgi:hypothetical protein
VASPPPNFDGASTSVSKAVATICDLREIHIDAQHIPSSLVSALEKIGYLDDHFVGAGNGMEKPPYHLTWQAVGARDQVRRQFAATWETSVTLVRGCPGFIGYLEAEFVPSGYQIALPQRPFSPVGHFPLPALHLEITSANKVSDLHMKVPLPLITPEMEALMASRNVFYVDTPSANRIFTVQFLSHLDGRTAFAAVVDYFRKSGGASEVSYEICSAFFRQPDHLVVPASVRFGSLTPIGTIPETSPGRQ